MSTRELFTGVRPVASIDDCLRETILYIIEDKFYKVVNDKILNVHVNDITGIEWAQIMMLLLGPIVKEKPEKPKNFIKYKDSKKGWQYYINKVWITLPDSFIKFWQIEQCGDSTRDLEAVRLLEKTFKEKNGDYYLRNGIWNATTNTPNIGNKDDNYQYGSLFVVTGHTSSNEDIVNTYPTDVKLRGVNEGDHLIKFKDGWKVIKMTNIVTADQIKYDDTDTVTEKITDILKDINRLEEKRFETYRGEIKNDSEVPTLMLKEGQYVINTAKGTVVYNNGGNIMETISGYIPKFNGRYGSIVPETGDYNTTQIVDREQTLDKTLNTIQSELKSKITFKGLLTKDISKPEVSNNGDLFYVIESFNSPDWNDDSVFKCLQPGDILIFNNGWHYISPQDNTISSLVLKVGGLLSELPKDAVNGSLVFIDDACENSSDLDIKDLYNKYGKGSLLVKINDNTFVNALPEVINAGLVRFSNGENLINVIDKLEYKIDEKTTNVGFLHITTSKPSIPQFIYHIGDCGYVQYYVRKGYIYNGLDYSEVDDLMPGTQLMLVPGNQWVILWSPPKFIGTVSSEKELNDVKWNGTFDHVMFDRNTEKYRIGDCVTNNGIVINRSNDYMPGKGNLYNSTSMRETIKQLDCAFTAFLLSEKTYIGKLGLDGWNYETSTLKCGDYFVASEAGKVSPKSAVIPNTLINKNNIIFYDGGQWHILNDIFTTDFIKYNDVLLTDLLKKSDINNIKQIVDFVDLTDEVSVSKVRVSDEGSVFKVSKSSTTYPDLKRGDYINNEMEIVAVSDTKHIPCTFDISALNMYEYIDRHKPVKLPIESLTDIQSKYPGVTDVYGVEGIVKTWNDSGYLSSIDVSNVTDKNSKYLFIK